MAHQQTAAQSGAIGLVTTDASGNLASDGGALQTQVNGYGTRFTGLEGRTTAIENQNTTNTTNITNLTNQVNTNTTNITNLDNRVTTNTTDITKLKSDVATNTTDIGGLKTRVTAVEGQTSTNTTQIASGLNAHGVRTRRGFKWTRWNMRAIVDNRPCYLGTHIRDPKTGELVRSPVPRPSILVNS